MPARGLSCTKGFLSSPRASARRYGRQQAANRARGDEKPRPPAPKATHWCADPPHIRHTGGACDW